MSAPQYPPQQHDDPVGEARTQLLQALAVAATVGEAGARWVAVGLQQRAARAEQTERATRATAQQAARMSGAQLSAEERTAREQIDRAFTDWLDKADLTGTARVWRTSAVAAATGNARAQEAMSRAEARLRRMHPGLMEAYDAHRAAGRGPAEAMRAAAYTVWETEARAHPTSHARPHGGPTPDGLRAGAYGRALGPGGPVQDEMDAALRAEVGRLAAHVSPEALDQLQRQWRGQGQAPAADAAGLLAQYARQARTEGSLPPVVADGLEATARRPGAARDGDDDAAARHLSGYEGAERRMGTIDYGSPDLTRTPADEHDAGLVAGAVAHKAADHDAAGAAQRRRMAQAFPPLTRVAGIDPVVAGKQPAQVVPTKRLGRGR